MKAATHAAENRTDGQGNSGVPVRHSLHLHLMAPLTAILLAVLLLIGMSVLLFVSRLETSAWRGRQSEAARASARAVSVVVEHDIETLRHLAAFDQNRLAASPTLLQDIIGPHTELLEILRLDSAGNVVASAYQDQAVLANQFTIALSQWFRTALDGGTYFGRVQLSSHDSPYLIIALPTSDRGVLAARLKMAILWDTVANTQFGDRGQVYIIDRQGRLVAHRNTALVTANTSVSGLPEYRNLLNSPNQTMYDEYINFESTPVVAVSMPINAANWLLIAELPSSEAYMATRSALVAIVVLALAFLVFTSWLVRRFLLASVLEPLEQLRKAVDRVTHGDLDHRTGIDRRDEIGVVAAGFDHMVDSLRERSAQLAEKVFEQTQTAHSLRENEARYRAIVEDQTELICRFHPSGTLLFVNEAYCRYFGKSREELIGHAFIPLIPDEDHQIVEAQVGSLCREHPVTTYQHRVLVPGNGIRWMEWTDRAIFDEIGEIVELQGVGRDVTQTRMAEEKFILLNAVLEQRVADRTQQLASTNSALLAEIEQRMRIESSLQASRDRLHLALQAASAGAWEWNIRTNQAVWSDENYQVMGLTPGSVEPLYENWLRCVYPADRLMADQSVAQAVKDRAGLNIEFRVLLPNGDIRWISDIGNLTFDETGAPVGMYGIQMDITKRRLVEEQLRASLLEKELLLKEIHHRVKNNLQIVSSLLSLQSESTDDQSTVAQFQDSQARIRSMALIHERLYRSNDLAHIDFAKYLSELAEALIKTYRRHKQSITLNVTAGGVILDIDTAIPCGLIVNELLSNALKHAFPGGRSGEIRVEMSRITDASFQIVVWDSGVGISDEIDCLHPATLGLQLVNNLTHQLDGTIEFSNRAGAYVAICFPNTIT